MNEFDGEPIKGLPEELPAGEEILWQGSSDWWALARHAFHIGLVAAYFIALMSWQVGSSVVGGEGFFSSLASSFILVPIALACIGLLCALAFLYSNTTVYTITNHRIVMRFGVALPKAVNLPFTVIDSAALKNHGNDVGSIPLVLGKESKVGYFHMWPNVRPGKLKSPQPMLRCVPQVGTVASILTRALRADVEVGACLQSTQAPVEAATEPLGPDGLRPAVEATV